MIPIAVEATIGVVASGTAGTIDRAVWDRDTSFVVDLYPDHALSSTGEADVLNNPELNLACVGSGTTYYVFQFTTVSAGSASPPFKARYTVSGLLWDRFGSGAPPAGSLAGLNFVLLNSAVKPVAAPVEDIGVPRNYKCSTAGQSTDDTETTSFTLAANSLRPLAPANLRAERDSADNALIQFERRSRLSQGLRDYADTPVGEEGERFVVEIPDAVPPRTMDVITGMSLAALLESSWSNKFTSITVNTLSLTTNSSFADIYARSAQRITQTGNFVEGTLVVTADGAVELGLINVVKDWRTAVADFRLRAELDGFTRYLRCYQGTTLLYERDIDAEFSGGVWEKRVRITLSGSEARFYESYVGTGTPPLAVSTAAPSFPLRARLYAGSVVVPDTVKVEKVVMTIWPQPATIYTAAQATADGLTPAGPYTVRAAQVSAVVGPGEYAEADL